MKVCPTCRRTYDDDGLNFCLEDGSVLTLSADESAAPTIAMHQPGPTNPSSGSSMPAGWNPPDPPARTPVQPRKSSKTWLWVLGIFAVLILMCGGGATVLFLATRNSDNTSPPRTTANTTRSNSVTRPSPSESPAQAENVQPVDLSEWVKEPSVWVDTEFQNDEFLMTSKQEGYYYVLVAKEEIETASATTRVTVRNVTDGDVGLGFGLIFHSAMTPLEKGYALLIDSKKKRYRVVRHENEEEQTVRSWTNSDLIRDGSAENLLEARDKGDKIDLYINGQLIMSVPNKKGPTGGVPGLYAGDGAKIGFKKLEVVK